MVFDALSDDASNGVAIFDPYRVGLWQVSPSVGTAHGYYIAPLRGWVNAQCRMLNAECGMRGWGVVMFGGTDWRVESSPAWHGCGAVGRRYAWRRGIVRTVLCGGADYMRLSRSVISASVIV